jgi:hypothetical protein
MGNYRETEVEHVVHENMEDGSSMLRFPLVIADSEQDMPGIKPGPLQLQEVRQYVGPEILGYLQLLSSVASDQNTDPKVTG